VRRSRPALLLAVVLLAACGGSSQAVQTTTTQAAPPGPGKVLYAGGPWAVVVNGTKATAFHRAGGVWRPDRSHAVTITVLGPQPGTKAARLPQVAAELRGNAPLVESGLWIDGRELFEKGGGLSPNRGSIYGAPTAGLAPGRHVAVAYARTDAHAAAIAWVFRV